MPGAIGDGPTVAMSFANNFWGKDDAGVNPLLERMHAAKQTNDELKSFYAGKLPLMTSKAHLGSDRVNRNFVPLLQPGHP